MTPRQVREIILRQSKRANVGHIGSCLSVVDILCALYGGVLRISSPGDPDRDRFILSKGHAGLALYAVLSLRGWISAGELETFYGEGTLLGVHPEAAVPGIDFSTGSLGHGLTFACGAALAARLQRSPRRVFCLISDAECNEGSVWESAMFAAHHRLDNLTAIIDVNGQQAFGTTREVLDLPNLRERWEAFGWDARMVDGHSLSELTRVLSAPSADAPAVVIARTTFGRGVSYMEQGHSPSRPDVSARPINWHYLPMTDDEFAIAIAEQGAAG